MAIDYQRTTLYFNSLCDTSVNEGLHCIPVVYSNTTAGFIPRTGTTYTEEMLPRYQAQTTDLKNGVNNAALIASILGQLFFGFAGDLLGRKVGIKMPSTKNDKFFRGQIIFRDFFHPSIY